MSTSVSVRVGSLRASNAAGQRNHDLRQGGHVPDYVDSTLTEQNSIIIQPRTTPELRQMCEELRTQRNPKRQMKSNANVGIAGIITFSTEAQSIIKEMSKEQQDSLYLEAANRIANMLKTEVVGLVVHRDETAPHAHFTLPGYDKDGFPISHNIKIDITHRMQDAVAEVYADFGITRGKPKQQRIDDGEDPSKIFNRSVRQLHEDLPAEIAAAEQRRADAEREAEEAEKKRERNERLANAAQAKLDAGRGDLDQLKKNIDIYKNRETAAKSDAERLEAEKGALDAEIASKKSLLSRLRENMPELTGKKSLLRKDVVISHEELNKYHDHVAGYILKIAESTTRDATKKEREALEARERSLIVREGKVTNREYELEAWNETLTTRENRITGHDELVTENQRLKTRLSTIGLHIGKVMGIENAGMNGGKILSAMESSFSISEFQKNLQSQRLTTGHDSGLTLGVS